MKWDGKVDVASELEAFQLRIDKGEKLSELESLKLRVLVLMDEYAKLYVRVSKLEKEKIQTFVKTLLNGAFVLQNVRLTRLEEWQRSTTYTSETLKELNETLKELNNSLRVVHERIQKLEQAVSRERPPFSMPS